MHSSSVNLKDKQNLHEDIYMSEVPETQLARSNKTTLTLEPSSAGHRCYRLVMVILLMLVVLLLSVAVTLWVNFHNMSVARGRLEISYNNLIIERDSLKKSYKTVAEERAQFQAKSDELQEMLSQLKKDINTPGWRYFSSSIYYISTEKKSWSESRQNCKERGTDLVIINNREEQDIVEVWRRGEGAWIGANDRNNEGIWKWVDGTAVSDGFWSSGEPNNKGEEDCAVSGYRSEPVPNWVDISCDSQYIWICEKNINI
ncbi:CD209 antigen-like protein B isoform X1 [Silurus meridionalis]|nr:CD209 antigen-like protein B isoform X1 [Silurus meridionalis]